MSSTQRIDIHECKDFVTFEELKGRDISCRVLVAVLEMTRISDEPLIILQNRQLAITVEFEIQATIIR
jgi:hypothetical protein